MAIAPRDTPITRAMVYDWLVQYELADQKPPIKEWIAGKLNDLDLGDVMVATSEHEDLENETPLLEMIMADLPSYGYGEGS